MNDLEIVWTHAMKTLALVAVPAEELITLARKTLPLEQRVHVGDLYDLPVFRSIIVDVIHAKERWHRFAAACARASVSFKDLPSRLLAIGVGVSPSNSTRSLRVLVELALGRFSEAYSARHAMDKGRTPFILAALGTQTGGFANVVPIHLNHSIRSFNRE